VGPGPLNTEDWPVLQYAARHLMGPDAMVANSYRVLSRGYEPITDRLVGLDEVPDGGGLAARIELFAQVNEILLAAMGASAVDPPAAARGYERASRLMPDHPFFRRSAARRAELAVLSPEQVRGRDLPALVGLVDELGRLGLFTQALAALEEWERREPYSSYVQERLGAVCLRLGLPDRAVQHLVAARTLGLDSADVNLNLGAALIDLARYDEAVRALERALSLAPQSAEITDRLGAACALAGDSDRALRLLQEAIRMDPDLPSAQQNMAVLLSRIGRAEDAVPYGRRLVELRPASADAHELLSRLLAAVGDQAAAQRHADRAAELRSSAMP
jgi:tetratricopeptide (TPR) repeat protein